MTALTTSQQPDPATPVASINGQLISWTVAGLPLWDLGVVAGAAVTEAGRTYAGRFLYADQHVDRLLQSLQALRFPDIPTRDRLLQATQQVIEHNFPLLPPGSDLGIVLFSTAGGNATYLGHHDSQPMTVVHSYPLPFELWRKSFVSGVRLTVSTIRQIPADCFPVTLKVRNRLHWWLADREADLKSPGCRALLLNRDGSVAETSTSSICVVRHNRVATPAADVLASLSSRLVETLCEQSGIPFERRRIDPAELADADEIFLTSSPSCLLPVLSVDNQQTRLSPGQGPVFRQLLQQWSLAAGVDLEQQMLQTASRSISH